MAHSDTVLKRLLSFRSYNRWSQFLVLLTGHLSRRQSLRDFTGNLMAQGQRLCRPGMQRTTKATLAWVNAEQPASLYQALLAKVLKRCQLAAPRSKANSTSWLPR